ncbi:hypothetical protein C8Q79DRAFT_928936 [Trametes meyenii]|nr:hypothetical protein C8Q79DRAFT_928936 [Trametes meyenii]
MSVTQSPSTSRVQTPSSTASNPSPTTTPAKRLLPTEFVSVGVSGRRKPKTGHQDSLFVRFGRHFVRTIAMFDHPASIITVGLIRDPEESANRFSSLENRRYDGFQALVKLVPTFAIMVDNHEPMVEDIQKWLDDFAGSLQLGASGAKSDDTRSLRGAIIDWIKAKNRSNPAVTNGLERDSKHGRGFRHNITGRLLCPVMLDWRDDSVRQSLLNHTATIDGNHINGSHWPAFLYAGSVYNKDVPWEGFLQGEYLLRTYCHIFTSPSSAKGDHEDGIDHSNPEDTKLATRSGNAANYGMTVVTKPSIAYAAAQLAFALSDGKTFLLRARLHVTHSVCTMPSWTFLKLLSSRRRSTNF